MIALVKWLLLVLGLGTLYVAWAEVPLQRLDRYWRLNNPIGRPLTHTLVLTGIPALVARYIDLPWPGLLIPICFVLTQYAVLSGRVIQHYFNVAGWVMLVATCLIWIAFFVA